jgi:hypothetical protein
MIRVDKIDFLVVYRIARLKAFKLEIIISSFAGASLILFNP